MLVFKIDVLSELKKKGFSSYKIQKDNILSGSTLVKLKSGKMVSISSLEKICSLLGCDIGDLVTIAHDE